MLGRDHRPRRVAVAALRDALRGDLDAGLGPEVDRLLDEAAVPPRRRARAREALLAERLAERRIGGCWLLDLPPGGSFWAAARRAGLPGRAAVLVGAHMAQHALLLLSWWVLGLGVLQGRLDPGWLLAWALLLLTVVPFRALELWSAGVLMARAGRLFKRRLLVGALRLEPEETRHQGAGQLLGRILNAEALEFLALTGGARRRRSPSPRSSSRCRSSPPAPGAGRTPSCSSPGSPSRSGSAGGTSSSGASGPRPGWR